MSDGSFAGGTGALVSSFEPLVPAPLYPWIHAQKLAPRVGESRVDHSGLSSLT